MTEASSLNAKAGTSASCWKPATLERQEWVQQPLPYGTTPRLVMVHLSSEAIRTQEPPVEIGDSMRQF